MITGDLFVFVSENVGRGGDKTVVVGKIYYHPTSGVTKEVQRVRTAPDDTIREG